jgi:hypothetical protein
MAKLSEQFDLAFREIHESSRQVELHPALVVEDTFLDLLVNVGNAHVIRGSSFAEERICNH